MSSLSSHIPCPHCSCPYAHRLDLTALSDVGEAVFRPLRCINCGTTFHGNARKGSRLLPLLLLVVVLGVAVFFVLEWLRKHNSSRRWGRRASWEASAPALFASLPGTSGNPERRA
jgi:hypothetical protein